MFKTYIVQHSGHIIFFFFSKKSIVKNWAKSIHMSLSFFKMRNKCQLVYFPSEMKAWSFSWFYRLGYFKMWHNVCWGSDRAVHSPKSDGRTLAETERKQHHVAYGTGYKGCQWRELVWCNPLCLSWKPESHQIAPTCHDTAGIETIILDRQIQW